MIKIKLLFSLFFLFAFQFSYSSSQSLGDERFFVGEETENQAQFDKDIFTQNIFGEIPKSHFETLGVVYEIQCYLPNFKSKDFQASFIQSKLRTNGAIEGALSNRGPSNRISNIPIYLQTGKIRL